MKNKRILSLLLSASLMLSSIPLTMATTVSAADPTPEWDTTYSTTPVVRDAKDGYLNVKHGGENGHISYHAAAQTANTTYNLSFDIRMNSYGTVSGKAADAGNYIRCQLQNGWGWVQAVNASELSSGEITFNSTYNGGAAIYIKPTVGEWQTVKGQFTIANAKAAGALLDFSRSDAAFTQDYDIDNLVITPVGDAAIADYDFDGSLSGNYSTKTGTTVTQKFYDAGTYVPYKDNKATVTLTENNEACGEGLYTFSTDVAEIDGDGDNTAAVIVTLNDNSKIEIEDIELGEIDVRFLVPAGKTIDTVEFVSDGEAGEQLMIKEDPAVTKLALDTYAPTAGEGEVALDVEFSDDEVDEAATGYLNVKTNDLNNNYPKIHIGAMAANTEYIVQFDMRLNSAPNGADSVTSLRPEGYDGSKWGGWMSAVESSLLGDGEITVGIPGNAAAIQPTMDEWVTVKAKLKSDSDVGSAGSTGSIAPRHYGDDKGAFDFDIDNIIVTPAAGGAAVSEIDFDSADRGNYWSNWTGSPTVTHVFTPAGTTIEYAAAVEGSANAYAVLTPKTEQGVGIYTLKAKVSTASTGATAWVEIKLNDGTVTTQPVAVTADGTNLDTTFLVTNEQTIESVKIMSIGTPGAKLAINKDSIKLDKDEVTAIVEVDSTGRANYELAFDCDEIGTHDHVITASAVTVNADEGDTSKVTVEVEFENGGKLTDSFEFETSHEYKFLVEDGNEIKRIIFSTDNCTADYFVLAGAELEANDAGNVTHEAGEKKLDVNYVGGEMVETDNAFGYLNVKTPGFPWIAVGDMTAGTTYNIQFDIRLNEASGGDTSKNQLRVQGSADGGDWSWLQATEISGGSFSGSAITPTMGEWVTVKGTYTPTTKTGAAKIYPRGMNGTDEQNFDIDNIIVTPAGESTPTFTQNFDKANVSGAYAIHEGNPTLTHEFKAAHDAITYIDSVGAYNAAAVITPAADSTEIGAGVYTFGFDSLMDNDDPDTENKVWGSIILNDASAEGGKAYFDIPETVITDAELFSYSKQFKIKDGQTFNSIVLYSNGAVGENVVINTSFADDINGKYESSDITKVDEEDTNMVLGTNIVVSEGANYNIIPEDNGYVYVDLYKAENWYAAIKIPEAIPAGTYDVSFDIRVDECAEDTADFRIGFSANQSWVDAKEALIAPDAGSAEENANTAAGVSVVKNGSWYVWSLPKTTDGAVTVNAKVDLGAGLPENSRFILGKSTSAGTAYKYAFDNLVITGEDGEVYSCDFNTESDEAYVVNQLPKACTATYEYVYANQSVDYVETTDGVNEVVIKVTPDEGVELTADSYTVSANVFSSEAEGSEAWFEVDLEGGTTLKSNKISLSQNIRPLVLSFVTEGNTVNAIRLVSTGAAGTSFMFNNIALRANVETDEDIINLADNNLLLGANRTSSNNVYDVDDGKEIPPVYNEDGTIVEDAWVKWDVTGLELTKGEYEFSASVAAGETSEGALARVAVLLDDGTYIYSNESEDFNSDGEKFEIPATQVGNYDNYKTMTFRFKVPTGKSIASITIETKNAGAFYFMNESLIGKLDDNKRPSFAAVIMGLLIIEKAKADGTYVEPVYGDKIYKMDFTSSNALSACGADFNTGDANVAGSSEFVTVDGVGCLKLTYSVSSTSESWRVLDPYRCAPRFMWDKEEAWSTNDHKFICITYMTTDTEAHAITLMDPGKGEATRTVIVPDASVSAGKFVTSAPVDISAKALNERFAKGAHNILEYESNSETSNIYIKEIALFKTESQAEKYAARMNTPATVSDTKLP